MYVFQYIDENNTMWCTIKIRLVIRLIQCINYKAEVYISKANQNKNNVIMDFKNWLSNHIIPHATKRHIGKR